MSKVQKLLLVIGIVVIVLIFYYAIKGSNDNLAAPSKTETLALIQIPTSFPSPSASPSATIYKEIKTMDGLIIQDIIVGTGTEAVSGQKITVNYAGTLTSGEEFDSSYKRGIPFSFTLGAGEVIKGWDEGFTGMKVGGKRKLTIPPELGYGSRDLGTIPPNSTLIFEVELLGVE
jgi:FKBP-type peptidyl-prolyl cis-trans isomerase